MTQIDFDALRETMVSNQLRTNAVSDPAVIAAMKAVPREAFVPGDRAGLAYVDTPVPLGEGRALNPPMATGRLLNALAPRRGETALVVGAATGYAAALLASMGVTVTGIEENAVLADFARGALADSAGVTIGTGALAAGWPANAPYDMILVDGAIAHLPEGFAAQLKDDGRIAAGRIERGVTRLASGRKAAGRLSLVDFLDAEAVTLPGFDIPAGFVF